MLAVLAVIGVWGVCGAQTEGYSMAFDEEAGIWECVFDQSMSAMFKEPLEGDGFQIAFDVDCVTGANNGLRMPRSVSSSTLSLSMTLTAPEGWLVQRVEFWHGTFNGQYGEEVRGFDQKGLTLEGRPSFGVGGESVMTKSAAKDVPSVWDLDGCAEPEVSLAVTASASGIWAGITKFVVSVARSGEAVRKPLDFRVSQEEMLVGTPGTRGWHVPSLLFGDDVDVSAITDTDMEWVSDSPDVADVGGDGELLLKRPGEAVLRVRFPGNAHYDEAADEVTVRVYDEVDYLSGAAYVDPQRFGVDVPDGYAVLWSEDGVDFHDMASYPVDMVEAECGTLMLKTLAGGVESPVREVVYDRREAVRIPVLWHSMGDGGDEPVKIEITGAASGYSYTGGEQEMYPYGDVSTKVWRYDIALPRYEADLLASGGAVRRVNAIDGTKKSVYTYLTPGEIAGLDVTCHPFAVRITDPADGTYSFASVPAEGNFVLTSEAEAECPDQLRGDVLLFEYDAAAGGVTGNMLARLHPVGTGYLYEGTIDGLEYWDKSREFSCIAATAFDDVDAGPAGRLYGSSVELDGAALTEALNNAQNNTKNGSAADLPEGVMAGGLMLREAAKADALPVAIYPTRLDGFNGTLHIKLELNPQTSYYQIGFGSNAENIVTRCPDVEPIDEETAEEWYDLAGRRIPAPGHGPVICRRGKHSQLQLR